MQKFAIVFIAMFTFFILMESANAQTVKFEETFDSTTLPADWTVNDVDGSGTAWSFVQQADFGDGEIVNPQAGQSFWFSDFNNANSSGLIDEWLISPTVAGIEAGDTLSIFAGAIDNGFNDSLKVHVSTDGGTTFTEIAYFKAGGGIGNYDEFRFGLDDFAGNDIVFAINYYIVNGGQTGAHSDNIWVDHFTITNTMATSIEDDPLLVNKFELRQNYPNPFNPSTKISFALAQNSEVTLKVYNLIGQKVAVVLEKELYARGNHTISFNASQLTNGIYYYKIETENFVDIKKMTLLK